jgi:hypothetical protein
LGVAAGPGREIQLILALHVPPATEEVIHCLQSVPTPVARIALIRKELNPTREVWKPVLVCRKCAALARHAEMRHRSGHKEGDTDYRIPLLSTRPRQPSMLQR